MSEAARPPSARAARFPRDIRRRCARERKRGRCCRVRRTLPGTLGRARPELGQGLRGFAIRGYIIFFRDEANTLVFINIVEGHRDMHALFTDDPT